MSQAEQDRRIDYIEFAATDLPETKRFYTAVFGWSFTDYGPTYTSFVDGRLAGDGVAESQLDLGGAVINAGDPTRSDLELLVSKASLTWDVVPGDLVAPFPGRQQAADFSGSHDPPFYRVRCASQAERRCQNRGTQRRSVGVGPSDRSEPSRPPSGAPRPGR